MMTSEGESPGNRPLHWPSVGAVYAGLLVGMAGLLYWGDYRNAAWLGLIGAGGACTAYSRVLEARGEASAEWWQWASLVFYGAFFIWAGRVLLRAL